LRHFNGTVSSRSLRHFQRHGFFAQLTAHTTARFLRAAYGISTARFPRAAYGISNGTVHFAQLAAFPTARFTSRSLRHFQRHGFFAQLTAFTTARFLRAAYGIYNGTVSSRSLRHFNGTVSSRSLRHFNGTVSLI